MTPQQMNAIDDLLVQQGKPPDATAGQVLLITGETLSGHWVFYKNIQLADFYDSNDVRWVIDIDKIMGFSPQEAPQVTP